MHGISNEHPKGFLPFTLGRIHELGLIDEELVIDVVEDIRFSLHTIREAAVRMDAIVIVMLFEYLEQFLVGKDGRSILDDSDKEYLIHNIREMYDRVEDIISRQMDGISDDDGQYDEEIDESDDGDVNESDDGEIDEPDDGQDDGPYDEPDLKTFIPGPSFIASLILKDDEVSRFIAEMVNEAHDKGFSDGFDAGYDEGYGDAGDDQYAQGYEEGYDDGCSDTIMDMIKDMVESDAIEIVEDTDDVSDDIRNRSRKDVIYDEPDHGSDGLYGEYDIDDVYVDIDDDDINDDLDDGIDDNGDLEDGSDDDIDDMYLDDEVPHPCDECSGSCCARCFNGAVCFDMEPLGNKTSRRGGA